MLMLGMIEGRCFDAVGLWRMRFLGWDSSGEFGWVTLEAKSTSVDYVLLSNDGRVGGGTANRKATFLVRSGSSIQIGETVMSFRKKGQQADFGIDAPRSIRFERPGVHVKS